MDLVLTGAGPPVQNQQPGPQVLYQHSPSLPGLPLHHQQRNRISENLLSSDNEEEMGRIVITRQHTHNLQDEAQDMSVQPVGGSSDGQHTEDQVSDQDGEGGAPPSRVCILQQEECCQGSVIVSHQHRDSLASEEVDTEMGSVVEATARLSHGESNDESEQPPVVADVRSDEDQHNNQNIINTEHSQDQSLNQSIVVERDVTVPVINPGPGGHSNQLNIQDCKRRSNSGEEESTPLNLSEDIFNKTCNNLVMNKYNNDKYLIIKVIRVLQEKEEAEIHFRVKQTTQLGKLKKSYSERVMVPLYLLRFLYDGKRIIDEHTPEMLEMESGDVIEVYDEMGSTSCAGSTNAGSLQQRRRQLSTSSSSSSTDNKDRDEVKLCIPKQEEEEYEEYPAEVGAVGGVTAAAGPSTSTSHVPAYLPVVDPDGQISDIAGASGAFPFFVPGNRHGIDLKTSKKRSWSSEQENQDTPAVMNLVMKRCRSDHASDQHPHNNTDNLQEEEEDKDVQRTGEATAPQGTDQQAGDQEERVGVNTAQGDEEGEGAGRGWRDVAEVEAELDKYKRKYENLVRKLRDKVECPVCYEVPKQSPIHVCSNGHIICHKCYRMDCPTCRIRMMGATSLLAVAVIEGIEHDCEWEGCGERHSLEKLGEHMAKCLHRQVECPYLECRKRLPVSRLLEHSLQCCVSEITEYNLPHKFGYSINMEMFSNRRGLHWKMKGIKFDDKIFILRVAFEQNMKRWSFTVLMLGGENSCSQYSAEIVVASAKSESRYRKIYCGDVCPIDISTVDKALEKDLCLTLSDAAMLKIASATTKFTFMVTVNILTAATLNA